MSLKIIQTGTIGKIGCGFLFAFRSNYGRIFNRLWYIQRHRIAWPWKLGYGLFKVIENGHSPRYAYTSHGKNEKVIRNRHAQLITSRGSPLAHVCLVWSTSVSAFVSCPVYRMTEWQTSRNSRSHNQGSVEVICSCDFADTAYVFVFFISLLILVFTVTLCIIIQTCLWRHRVNVYALVKWGESVSCKVQC